MILPLCGRVVPFSGESLASIVARSACANVIPSTRKLLSQTNIVWGRPAFVAFTHADAVKDLAGLLGISMSDVVERLHPKAENERSNRINWFGTLLDRRFLEASKRRFSPVGLAQSDFVRSEWAIRPLAYCPHTFDRLRDACPHCGAPLGWDRSLGLSVCEKCECDIKAWPVETLPADRRPAYSIISGLVSPDPVRRKQSLDRFPLPFRGWQAGDLFAAIVDLGYARGSPAEKSTQCMANGDFSQFSDHHLFLGYDLLMNWSDAFPRMIQETIQSRSAIGQTGTKDSLGLIGVYFYSDKSETTLTEFIRLEVPKMIRNLNLPLRVVKRSIILNAKREGGLSLREARDKYKLDNRVLARLTDKADCFIARQHFKNGTRLFEDDGLQQAVAAYRGATTQQALVTQLGVPPCVVDACEQAGLFKRVSNKDALLLAGDMIIYDTESVSEFIGAFGRHCNGQTNSTHVSLLEGLRGCLIPGVWAQVFQKLASGQLAFHVAGANSSWSESIQIDFDLLKTAMKAVACQRVPENVFVSMRGAATLLGIDSPTLGAAAKEGLLVAERNKSQISVALTDLDAFRVAFALNPELDEVYRDRSVPWQDQARRAGLEPVARLNGRPCWARQQLDENVR